MERPMICQKRDCYIQPRSLFPEWSKFNIACDECPYLTPAKTPEEVPEKIN